MRTAKDRLIAQINGLKQEWDETGTGTFGEYLVAILGLEAQVETYAIPDSTRRRWVTAWEDG